MPNLKKNNDTVYVTGHIHPDADSIASAIAYAFFKRAQGMRAVPCRLGSLNSETEFLLKKFGFKEPMLLKDARVTLGEIELDPVNSILPDTTIFEAMRKLEKGPTYCGVVNEEGKLVGLVTKSDVAVIGLGDTATSIDIMTHTPIDNFRKVIDGTTVYEDEIVHLNGKVSIIAMTAPENLGNYNVKDRIVIVGNDPEAQKEVISNGAGLVICVWTKSIREDVVELAKQMHCSIILSGHGSMNTSRYLYFAPPVELIMKKDPITFSSNELAEDVGAKMMHTRFHIYPVVDPDGYLTGYAARYHIMTSENKKIIMVDHNEFSQSVRAIEKARVLEVIDHHRINDFMSIRPVAFRNEIIGSTATIVATIFRENQIPIPQNLAGLLLGAILSDTMNFHSPTSTPKDRETANILAAIADIEIDDLAEEMFSVASDNSGKSLTELINTDMKIYEIQNCKLSISQVIVPSVEKINKSTKQIQQAVESFAAKKDLDLSVVVFTSILENGSVVYSGGNRAAWVQEAFPNTGNEENSFQPGILSRKQQILPKLSDIIERYS